MKLVDRLIDRIADQVAEKVDERAKQRAVRLDTRELQRTLAEENHRFAREIGALVKIDGKQLARIVSHGPRKS